MYSGSNYNSITQTPMSYQTTYTQTYPNQYTGQIITTTYPNQYPGQIITTTYPNQYPGQIITSTYPNQGQVINNYSYQMPGMY